MTDWSQTRAIMYEPSACWLATEGGDRWLTDQYVLFDVSDLDEFEDIPDGAYKLTVSKGPVERKAIAPPDLEAYFAITQRREWVNAHPTEWSIYEHPGKAMLWDYSSPQCPEIGRPCLLGESTWTAIKRYVPDCMVEYALAGNIFRFTYTEHPAAIFAYAAGIQIPDGREAEAQAIVDVL